MGRMMQTVAARLDPIADGVKHFALPAGLTIDQIVSRAETPDYFWQFGEVRLNGHKIPRNQWHVTRPKPASDDGAPVIVELVIPLMGGRGTRKVLTTVASIALIAATAWVGGGGLAAAFPEIFGTAFAAGGMGATAAAVGLGVLGSLALNALAPPPLAPNAQSAQQDDAAKMAGIQANAAKPLDQMPAVIGRMRASPPQIQPPYTILRGKDIEAKAIYVLAGHYQVSDVLINGSPAGNYTGVSIEVKNVGQWSDDRLSSSSHTFRERPIRAKLRPMSLKTETGKQDWLQDQATPENSWPAWQSVVSHSGTPEAVRVFIQFPAGIMAKDQVQCGVPIYIQIRKSGAASWITLPELHFTDPDKTQRTINQMVELVWHQPPVYSTPVGNGVNAMAAFGFIPAGDGRPHPHSYFANGTQHEAAHVDAIEEGFRIWLDPQVFGRGKYEIRIKQGLGYRTDQFDIHSYKWNGANPVFYQHISSSPYKAAQAQAGYITDCMIAAVQTETADYPAQVDNVCLLSVHAAGVQIQSVSAIFERMCKTKSDGWASDVPTRNPAAIYRQMLTDARWNARPVPDDIIDFSEIDKWYDDCAARSLTCDAVITGSTALERTLQMVASAGYAQPGYGPSNRPIRDYDRSTDVIRQVFAEHNTAKIEVEKTFPEVPDAIRAEFLDEDNDYAVSHVIVWRSGRSSIPDPDIEIIRYDGLTNEALVRKRAAYDLAVMEKRTEKVSFDLFAENMLSARGDLVQVSRSVVGSALSSARIVDVIRNGSGEITGLVLDTIPNWFSQPLNIMTVNIFDVNIFGLSLPDSIVIRMPDGTTVTRHVSPPPEPDIWAADDIWSMKNVWHDAGTTIYLDPPFADGGQVVKGCMIVLASTWTESRRMIVFSIHPKSDYTARMELIPEAPEVWEEA